MKNKTLKLYKVVSAIENDGEQILSSKNVVALDVIEAIKKYGKLDKNEYVTEVVKISIIDKA